MNAELLRAFGPINAQGTTQMASGGVKQWTNQRPPMSLTSANQSPSTL